MKKRIITILATLALTSCITACSGTYASTNSGTENSGDYFCYYSDFTSDYLDFLKTFNYEKYEIVNITNGYSRWYVTYKLKE